MSKPLSLVHKLQTDAQDSKVPVASLLRQAKTIAVKLDVQDLADWIESELNGYKKGIPVPDYRKVHCTFKAYDPHYGWQTVQIPNQKLREIINCSNLGSSVEELENILAESKGKILGLDLHPNQKQMLHELVPNAHDVEVHIPSNAHSGILNAVRNILLDWALKLEKAGILGDNLVFSKENKMNAQPLTQNFYAQNIGHVGNVSDSATVNNTITNNNAYDIEKIRELIGQINASSAALPDNIREDAVAVASQINQQISVPADKQDSKLLAELLGSLRKICESASGNLLARGIVSIIGSIMS